jgi:hypothetical protein
VGGGRAGRGYIVAAWVGKHPQLERVVQLQISDWVQPLIMDKR